MRTQAKHIKASRACREKWKWDGMRKEENAVHIYSAKEDSHGASPAPQEQLHGLPTAWIHVRPCKDEVLLPSPFDEAQQAHRTERRSTARVKLECHTTNYMKSSRSMGGRAGGWWIVDDPAWFMKNCGVRRMTKQRREQEQEWASRDGVWLKSGWLSTERSGLHSPVVLSWSIDGAEWGGLRERERGRVLPLPTTWVRASRLDLPKADRWTATETEGLRLILGHSFL